jgi:GNAT superfamily N-acetyltransferase
VTRAPAVGTSSGRSRWRPTGSTRRRCAALPGAEGVRARLPWPQVRLLAVAPPGRGRGVGAALMQECVRRARAAGAPVLALPTTELMRAALRLYRLDLG